jgi:hypothetical protein
MQKMNKLIVLLVFLFIPQALVKSQGTFECSGIIGTHPSLLKSGYVYDPNISIRYVKINIHYMLKTDGTGNFTETTDGVVSANSPYNGYTYAALLVNTANQRLASNPKMNLPPNNATPNYPKQYRFILAGVYFHRNSNYYYYPNGGYLLDLYGVNLGSEINIFFDNANGQNGGGQASMSGSRMVEIRGAWDTYNQWYATNKLIGTWALAGTITHEIGHNLGLDHTVRYSNGPCCATGDASCGDNCDDTPSRDQMLALGFDACCGFNQEGIATCDNNLMNYTGDQALTPCQLGIVFGNFTKDESSNGTKLYLTCSFTTNVLDLCSLGSNQLLYNAKTINFPASGCMNGLIPVGQSIVFTASDGINLNNGFEVQLGSSFETSIISSCQ